ncbi:hypothetical protein ACHMW6_00185 (plasmid) [Pseudoduganella sp. UC29_106]|uniref:hypothetical protein n=1 Tax=Pseudoduganella sp. UC29_106 TaxID=3374553 RepID=UPI003756CCAE
MKNAGPTSANFAAIEPYNNFLILTKYSTLIGAIELSGRDPDGLTAADHAGLCAISQSIIGALPRSVTITEYFEHSDGSSVQVRRRDDPRSDALSQQRESYLNSKNLNRSRIVHYFEIDPSENLNDLDMLGLLRHGGMAMFSQRSRTILQNALSWEKNFLLDRSELARQAKLLQDGISEVLAKWGGLFKVKQLTTQEQWAHMKFIASLDPQSHEEGLTEAVPEEDMDAALSPGDVVPVTIGQIDLLKISGVTNVYAKLASVRRFSRKRGLMQPGLWAAQSKAPVRLPGNYLIMTRWKPRTEASTELFFGAKNRELDRARVDLFSVITGKQQSEEVKNANLKESIRKKISELGIAESVSDVWGIGSSLVCVFGRDPKAIQDTATALKAALGNAHINVTWESLQAPDAFASMQPGNGHKPFRTLHLTSSQFAAGSLIYQSSEGQVVVPDMRMRKQHISSNRRTARRSTTALSLTVGLWSSELGQFVKVRLLQKTRWQRIR